MNKPEESTENAFVRLFEKKFEINLKKPQNSPIKHM